ncbi:MAG: sulfatase-like hydrolase/transferase [Lentisphaerae bacterium]|nr:sulfatase-like hydrolase/transferase [Lentisphaerota bacterium]
MKAILVFFDSLNRRFIPPYGGEGVKAPNFQRLADHAVTFTRSYVGSMPCIPARRELHTGRYNFLHRCWGPLEPFDVSMPELLKQKGIYTHLVSDHCHYWEDGGATYHGRYNSWEFFRGQEGDPWKGQVRDPEIPDSIGGGGGNLWRQEWVNRPFMKHEEDWSQTQTFNAGLEFIERNRGEDNWFLQIECFDPHPPFFAPQKYRDLYPHDYRGPLFDWPPYARVSQTPEQVEHARREYAALVSMCDASLGRVLDAMDRNDLWKDTLLILATDHGFLLGEHDEWAFCRTPFYNEVANTPLFVWDPRAGRRGDRCDSLVQTIDLAPTLLEFFGVTRPPEVQGVPLRDALARNAPVHDTVLFGIHGGHVNCTDGRYVYMRAPVKADNEPLFDYTLVPMHMRRRFSPDELKTLEPAGPFAFTRGSKVWRCKTHNWGWVNAHAHGTLLFDLEKDPEQRAPLQDRAVEEKMLEHLRRLMKAADAPPEQYARIGLKP